MVRDWRGGCPAHCKIHNTVMSMCVCSVYRSTLQAMKEQGSPGKASQAGAVVNHGIVPRWLDHGYTWLKLFCSARIKRGSCWLS